MIYRGWILKTSMRCHLCLAVTHKVSLTCGLCPLCVLYWFAFTRSMTCWRDYICRLAWDHLDVLPEKLERGRSGLMRAPAATQDGWLGVQNRKYVTQQLSAKSEKSFFYIYIYNYKKQKGKIFHI